MELNVKNNGTCSRGIRIVIEDGRISHVEFDGGCDGNLKGISALVIGKTPEETAALLSGITCGSKQTSCPDQLARALKDIKID